MEKDLKKQIIKAEIYLLIAFLINIIIAFVSEDLRTITGLISMAFSALLVLPYSPFISTEVLIILLSMINYFIWLVIYTPGLAILYTNKKKYKFAILNIIAVYVVHLVFIIIYMYNINDIFIL